MELLFQGGTLAAFLPKPASNRCPVRCVMDSLWEPQLPARDGNGATADKPKAPTPSQVISDCISLTRSRRFLLAGWLSSGLNPKNPWGAASIVPRPEGLGDAGRGQQYALDGVQAKSRSLSPFRSGLVIEATILPGKPWEVRPVSGQVAPSLVARIVSYGRPRVVFRHR